MALRRWVSLLVNRIDSLGASSFAEARRRDNWLFG
jgi:hypothetical protein